MFRILFYPTPHFRPDKHLHENTRAPLDELEDSLSEIGVHLSWRSIVGCLEISKISDDLQDIVNQNVNQLLNCRYGGLRVSNGTDEIHITPQAVMDDLRRLLARDATVEPTEIERVPPYHRKEYSH